MTTERVAAAVTPQEAESGQQGIHVSGGPARPAATHGEQGAAGAAREVVRGGRAPKLSGRARPRKDDVRPGGRWARCVDFDRSGARFTSASRASPSSRSGSPSGSREPAEGGSRMPPVRGQCGAARGQGQVRRLGDARLRTVRSRRLCLSRTDPGPAGRHGGALFRPCRALGFLFPGAGGAGWLPGHRSTATLRSPARSQVRHDRGERGDRLFQGIGEVNGAAGPGFATDPSRPLPNRARKEVWSHG